MSPRRASSARVAEVAECATNGALPPALIPQSHPTLSGMNGPKVPCSQAARHSLPEFGASHGGQRKVVTQFPGPDV
jgi:hypothetical protein